MSTSVVTKTTSAHGALAGTGAPGGTTTEVAVGDGVAVAVDEGVGVSVGVPGGAVAVGVSVGVDGGGVEVGVAGSGVQVAVGGGGVGVGGRGVEVGVGGSGVEVGVICAAAGSDHASVSRMAVVETSLDMGRVASFPLKFSESVSQYT
jgi:hypothetical protein